MAAKTHAWKAACAFTVMWLGSDAAAQEACTLLCTPSLKVEPTVTFAEREAEFELIVAVDMPTRAPRLGFTVEAMWTPFGRAAGNPFTGRSAADVGVPHIRDNPVELEFEANLKWLLPERTRGWVSSHFDVVDKFSPAEQPDDTAVYTHKLNLELDTAVALFNWLPPERWLRRIELEGSLDYLVTGRWSFSVVLVVPVAPL